MDRDELHELAWSRLPVDIKQRAVGRLRYAYDDSFFEEIGKLANQDGLGNWLPPFWHFGQGMHVRNVLRSDYALKETISVRKTPLDGSKTIVRIGTPFYPPAIKDEELPPLPEWYGEGITEGNWDDYYIQCVEAAAGLRAIE